MLHNLVIVGLAVGQVDYGLVEAGAVRTVNDDAVKDAYRGLGGYVAEAAYDGQQNKQFAGIFE